MLRPVFRFRRLLNGSFRGAGSRFLYWRKNVTHLKVRIGFIFRCRFACMRYRAEIFTFVYMMGVANAGVVLVYLRKTEHWDSFLGLFCILCIRYILSTGCTLLVWLSEVKGQSGLSDKNVQQEYLYRRNAIWKSRRTINLQRSEEHTSELQSR